ncbi:MAG TPA: hypothetical protein VN047_14985 [Sphingopyxis sp.]|uniref:hypothetical protein n=1 Tax=Sphingopyxis sp. TaxID=1908224 RepID=UPI002B6C342A|nr:hypothetical protein [Sphingopyxis sp.]HWW58195.1 hypothetical protein [Sphingopyxis sp.]
MMRAGWLGSALLLLAALPMPSLADDTPAAASRQVAFAPPVGQPLTYRVTTRRIGRDGSLVSFSLVYALQWHRAGRGYRLEAALQRIDSDARPEVVRALTLLLQPLVGEAMAYLVSPDGSNITLVDPEGLWERVTVRAQTAGAEAGRPEARQVAQLLAALSPAQRDDLATADIRALVAPANEAISFAAQADGASVSAMEGALRTIAQVERDSAAVGGGAQPLEIDNLWTLDTETGLVMREQRQSWIVEAGGDARTLVEEQVRTLELAPQI